MVLPVIGAHFLTPLVLAGLRSTYLAAGNVLLLPDAVSEEEAAALRQSGAPRLRDFFLADRGRYQHCEFTEPLDSLRALIEGLTARPVSLSGARLLRFQPGDYSLMKDSSAPAEASIEATLDLSPSEVPWADVNYTRGRLSIAALPHVPRSLSVVDRSDRVLRYERYLPLSRGPAEVWRLRALFV